MEQYHVLNQTEKTSAVLHLKSLKFCVLFATSQLPSYSEPFIIDREKLIFKNFKADLICMSCRLAMISFLIRYSEICQFWNCNVMPPGRQHFTSQLTYLLVQRQDLAKLMILIFFQHLQY